VTEFQKLILIIVILVISAIMAVLQMWSGESVPIEFWAVIYAVLGSIGIAVTLPTLKSGVKRIGKVFKD
jgi:hypothetical protein